MRHLKKPTKSSSKNESQHKYAHRCEGLSGLTAFYAFSTKGLLKIINELVDPECTGHYYQSSFYLTTKYTRDELLDKITSSYKPSLYIPSYSKSFQLGINDSQIEELKERHPEFYEATVNAKKVVQSWLKKKSYKLEDLRGDVLVELFHNLPSLTEDKEVIEYLKTAAVPYTITKKNGKKIKKLWYSPLFNKSLGRYGKGTIFTSYLNAIRDVDRDSWEACIFGAPHKVIGEYPLYQFDLKNWGGQREGKIDRKKYSKGIGVSSGERSVGVAADVLLLISSLTFFRGYLGEQYVPKKESTNSLQIKQKPIFTLCVRNTAPSFHTGLWCEMGTANCNPHLMGVEELFVPLWSAPMTYQKAKECLAETAELPIETYLNSKKDLMSHLSLHAKRTAIDSYIRFSCVGRGGTGMAKLNFLIPVEEFDPKKSRRNDIILPFNSLFNECLFSFRSGSLPYTLQSSVESFVNSINDFSMSRSTPREIMFSFLGVVEALETSPYDGGKLLSSQRLNVKNFTLPQWWIDVLERDCESSEMRIAKSISLQKQLCDFNDLILLVEGKLDNALINGYISFLSFIEIDHLEEISSEKVVWLPIDFLVHFKFASYKKYDFSDQKSAWSFLLENNDSFGALGVALDCLYQFDLITSFIYPVASTEMKDMDIALKIPFGSKDIRRLRNQIK